jgi:hypothetical protein
MIHLDRTFFVTDVETAEDLAEKLTEQTWTLCTGFRLDNLLFLNDSFSEDGAQEYAVIRDNRQVESITFSWVNSERALELIIWLMNGGTTDMGLFIPHIDTSPSHRCPLCA